MTQAIARNPHGTDLRKWQNLLRDLFDDMETWADSAGWRIKRQTIQLDEQPWGSYEAPWLQLRNGKRVVTIEPVARRVTRADGLLTIQGTLPFKKLFLARHRGTWKVYTEERIPWPDPWSKAAFLKLAEALTAP